MGESDVLVKSMEKQKLALEQQSKDLRRSYEEKLMLKDNYIEELNEKIQILLEKND